jgi:hypothetical protein
MKLKKLLVAGILFIALGLTKIIAQTVYITETGKKYHAKYCSVAKTGKKGISLKDAKKEGYEACKICTADEIVMVEEKKKTSKSKK